MLSWQSLIFDVTLSLLLLLIVALYGYFLQRGLSVGGLVLSWNFNNDYLVTLLLPPLLIAVTAVALVTTGKLWLLPGLWLASLFLFLLRGLLLIGTNRIRSVCVSDWLSCGVLSIAASFVVARIALYAQDSLRLSPSTAAVLVWSFGLLSFLMIIRRVLPSRFSGDAIQEAFYGHLYIKFYKKFHKTLKPEFKNDVMLHRIFFAILITEDMNRPAVFRFFERLAFPLGFIGTTGIMQVMNKEKLTDERSIVLAQRMILSYYQAAKQKRNSEFMQVQEIAYRYNDGDFYYDLISRAYFMLVELEAESGTTKVP